MRGAGVLLLHLASSQNLFAQAIQAIGSFIGGDSQRCTDIHHRPCIFPFTYDGRQFHQCTTYNSVDGEAWCASSVDGGGTAQCQTAGNCANCSPGCPGSEAHGSRSCRDVHGKQCIFPFHYQGETFHQCTTVGSVNGQPWCASSLDREGNALCATGTCEDCSSTCPASPPHRDDGNPPDEVCRYTCTSGGGCSVLYTGPPRMGNTKGSCFAAEFGGGCSGTPRECRACNTVRRCASQGAELPPTTGRLPPQIKGTCTDVHGKQCIFPFHYQGETFHQCTAVGSVNGQPWCASSVDRDGNALCARGGPDGQPACEDCSTTCSAPRPPSPNPPEAPKPTPQPPPAQVGRCTTVGGNTCIFPFRYKGGEFHRCTAVDSGNGREWCATRVDARGNAQCHVAGGCQDCSGCVGQPIAASTTTQIPRQPKVIDNVKPEKSQERVRIWQSQNCNRLRIRKDVTTLTSAEKQTLQTAFQNAVRQTAEWANFQDLASFHGHTDTLACTDPNTRIPCHRRPCTKRGPLPCCPHGTEDLDGDGQPDFLPWHRLYLVQLEELLEPWLAGTNLGLPYWDWSKDWATIPDFLDGVHSPIKDSHVFYGNWTSGDCRGNNKDFSQRVKEGWEDHRHLNSKLPRKVSAIVRKRNFRDFSKQLSDDHGAIHVGLKCTMAPVGTAAYDPIFWMHHAYVDKVFADWQTRHSRPKLSRDTYLDPFDNPVINKFYHKTHKTPDETLDYTENLCYCYDNDCPRNGDFYFDERGKKVRMEILHSPPRAPPLDDAPRLSPTERLIQQVNEEFEIYVAVVVPDHIGGRGVTYKVCRETSDGEDCSEEDTIALFGTAENADQETTVSSESHNIKESLFLPAWPLSNSIDAITAWTRIQLLDGSELVPELAPPFFVYRFTRDLEKVAHLQEGAQKQRYGDLLDDFTIKDYCGRYSIDDQSWDFGHVSICGESSASGNTTVHGRSNGQDNSDYEVIEA